MVAVVIGIGHRVTHLAGELAAVHLVENDPILSGGYVDMAAFAARRLDPIVQVVLRLYRSGSGAFMAANAFSPLAMHFLPGMAVDAVHLRFRKMDIGLGLTLLLAQILISNSGVMARAAVQKGRGILAEQMPIDEAAPHRCRLADMAIAAGGMATGAIFGQRLAQSRMLRRETASTNRSPDAGQVDVHAAIFMGYDIRVAFSTSCLRLVRRIADHTCVSRFHIRILNPAVAVDAAQRAVDCFHEFGPIHQHFGNRVAVCRGCRCFLIGGQAVA